MRDFPGGLVVKTSPSNAGRAGSIRDWGAKIPHALWSKNQNIKQKQYCNISDKDFKNDPTSKTKILKKRGGGAVLRNEATMAKASTNKGKNEVTDGSGQKIVKIWYKRTILWI